MKKLIAGAKQTASASERVEVFIAKARKHLGYQSGLLGRNGFGQRVGYETAPWSGAFIDVLAREAGLDIPACVYTPAAIAEALKRKLVVRTPRPGDIAIYNFATDAAPETDQFQMPHCGIVVDAKNFTLSGSFQVIEANTRSGFPRAELNQKDGVYLRGRRNTEVLMFIRAADVLAEQRRFFQAASALLLKLRVLLNRPGALITAAELDELKAASADELLISMGDLRPGSRKKSSAIARIQLALSTVTELKDAKRGVWDGATRAACLRFQRNIGRVGAAATGEPDEQTLQRLSQVTGLFKIG